MIPNTILHGQLLCTANALHQPDLLVETDVSIRDSLGTPLAASASGSGVVLSRETPEQVGQQLSELAEQPSTQQLVINLLWDGEILGQVTYHARTASDLGRLDIDRCRRDVCWAAQVLSTARVAERHERNAQYDALTGVFNRRAFDQKLPDEWTRANGSAQASSVALLMIDIDFFKSINDAFTHVVGDQALRLLAQILMGTVRVTDFVARFGGEEFAVIAPETGYADALDLAERIRRAVESAGFPYGTLTVSIGVAVTSSLTSCWQWLLAEADRSLFMAKDAGRNCVCSAACD